MDGRVGVPLRTGTHVPGTYTQVTELVKFTACSCNVFLHVENNIETSPPKVLPTPFLPLTVLSSDSFLVLNFQILAVSSSDTDQMLY